MITEETVAHVAKLARLELTPEETTKYTQDLGQILTLVDELSELDLSAIDMTLAADAETLLRDDVVKKAYQRDELLKNAPNEEDGFFRVPKILDEGN